MSQITVSFTNLIGKVLFVDTNAIYSGSTRVLSKSYMPVLCLHYFCLMLAVIALVSNEGTAKLAGDHFKYTVGNSAIFWRLMLIAYITFSTFIASSFFVMAKFYPSRIAKFFIFLKPVLTVEVNRNLEMLHRKYMLMLRLVKFSYRLTVISMVGWELVALFNIYQSNELQIYDVIWAIRISGYGCLMYSTWSSFMLLFVTGCNIFAFRCQVLRYRIARAKYDITDLMLTFNRLISDIKIFDNITKYVLAIFDVCLLPMQGIIVNQLFNEKFNAITKLILSFTFLLLLLLLMTVYVIATITNSNFNRTQAAFAKKITNFIPQVDSIRITHTESYKASYLICRIFTCNPLGLTLTNLTVITKMKLLKTIIQFSRFCLLGYKMRHLLDV